ncbi:MAG: hypothetical protein AAFR67_08125 [Chloroflexota bacterium]
MSIENVIREMPKVDLHVQFEGAIDRAFIKQIAEQTDIAKRDFKKPREYQKVVKRFAELDFKELDEIARMISSWVRHPEDIARAVYDLAVGFNKQNIKYAEIAVNPAIYTDLGITFPNLMDALHDGADRSKRAWGVEIKWLMSMPRERPRKSDDIARWATSATGAKLGVIGLTLVGREDAQPIAQFKKAFSTAEKAGIARITHMFSYPDADSFDGVLSIVEPQRITDAWGVLDSPDAVSYLVEHDIPILVTPSREVKLGRIDSIADYPISEMLENGLNVAIGSGMPSLFETSVTDEYIALAEGGVTIEEIQLLNRNAIRASLMESDAKRDLMANFEQSIIELHDQYLAEAD